MSKYYNEQLAEQLADFIIFKAILDIKRPCQNKPNLEIRIKLSNFCIYVLTIRYRDTFTF